jgi:hypothetical protein
VAEWPPDPDLAASECGRRRQARDPAVSVGAQRPPRPRCPFEMGQPRLMLVSEE